MNVALCCKRKLTKDNLCSGCQLRVDFCTCKQLDVSEELVKIGGELLNSIKSPKLRKQLKEEWAI